MDRIRSIFTHIVIRKLIAAGLSVGFFAVVRPEDEVPLWIVAILAIMFYECLQFDQNIQTSEKDRRTP